MTQKKAKAEIPTDMWLHVATDALARYGDGGGIVGAREVTEGPPGLLIVLPDVLMNDPRLSQAFVEGMMDITGAATACRAAPPAAPQPACAGR